METLTQTQARRMEIISEEPDFAAETEDYRLKLKQAKVFYTQEDGWVGTVYFKHAGPDRHAGFTANTLIYGTRELALENGKELMNKIQAELDRSTPPLE
ncbi:MAG TPA: hypothetical protein VJ246_01865 [Patescibacteria group bacterium]|nr:hypothetical protein [Patescibacteria group bacterium]